jgi:large subunit ribosomal protein L17
VAVDSARTSAHRKALGRNLLRALLINNRITTTLAKAKEYRPMADKLVTIGKTDTPSNRVRAMAIVPDRDLVDKLFGEVATHFKDRKGGYTRVLKLAKNRLGDNGEQAILEFVDLAPVKSGDA